MFLLYTSWRFPLSASQRRSEKRLSKQPQPLTSALHPLYTHSWKMALSLSRASLFCGFFGVVIFCLFTISSYVHVHLLRKFNKNHIVWKLLKKLVKIEFLFLFFLRHFWSIFRQFEQFVSKDFTGFLKKKWKIEHERKKYVLALAK